MFASFFGAAMVASAFAYFNFKYSEFKFIDFSKLNFFYHRHIFIPQEDKYIFVVYSSRATHNINNIVTTSKYPVLMLDIHQENNDDLNNSYNLKTTVNTAIQVIQRFNIYTLPSALIIRRYNKKLFKQNSKIEILQP
jgi:hypothetical protein